MRRIALIALTLAGCCALAQADVYRWIDEHGEPHYSDQWVPGSEVIKTSSKARPGDSPRYNDQKTMTALTNGALSDVKQETNTKAVQSDLKAERAAQCKKATDAYNQAITARVVYKTGSDGEKTYLDEAAADKYREQMRQAVQDYCGSVPKFDPEAPLNPQPQVLNPQPQPIPEPKVNPALATSE